MFGGKKRYFLLKEDILNEKKIFFWKKRCFEPKEDILNEKKIF